MLLATVFLWALNLSVTRYILTHGLAPLSYATVRYGLAGLVFVGLALATLVALADSGLAPRATIGALPEP